MVDRTFSDEDIVRIFCNNLTSDERETAHAFFVERDSDCSRVFEDNESDKEKKERLKRINASVKVANPLVSAAIGAVSGLLLADSEEKQVQQDMQSLDITTAINEINEQTANLESLTEFIPRGRNRRAYELYISRLRTQGDILKPCVFISEKYNEMVSAYDEAKRASDAFTESVNDLTDEVIEWFGF